MKALPSFVDCLVLVFLLIGYFAVAGIILFKGTSDRMKSELSVEKPNCNYFTVCLAVAGAILLVFSACGRDSFVNISLSKN